MQNKFLYYPGCTLKTKAKELDGFARKSLELLGVVVEEVREWQCCGAVYPEARDELAARLSAVRVLVQARDTGLPVLTLCSACHHVLKRVNDDIRNDAEIRNRINNYLDLPAPYRGEAEVFHFVEVLRDGIGFDEFKKHVQNPLQGQKLAAYYGCMLLRPAEVMQFDDAENPKIVEEFIAALGGIPVKYAMRNECCGSYGTLTDAVKTTELSGNVKASAAGEGADVIVTFCPLCKYNLDLVKDEGVKVKYFTKVVYESLGNAD
ncbi:MAG: heterodisulfide reductase-related iron-sulfur binding cluster [Defluviitaleaceae bacterium]|nr:heterodisulfide reductase-related iron-sulfur binding cluster [Defluviitaleaceae bacterium]